MINYVYYNEIKQPRYYIIFNLIISMFQEIYELFSEILQLKFKNSLMEIADIYHSLIIFIFMSITPKKIWLSPYLWGLIYILSLGIAPYKHGFRYIKHKCIRSIQHCLKGDHICNTNKSRV
jgi:hypothetical protein